MEVQKTMITEYSEPKRKIIRSDVLLFIVVLVAVIAADFLITLLTLLLELPEILGQLLAMAMMLTVGYTVYKKRLISYRYRLTDRMVNVDRIVGKKETPLVAVHLKDLLQVVPRSEIGDLPKTKDRLTHGDAEEQTVLIYRQSGGRAALIISPSEEFLRELLSGWKAIRK